MSRYSTEVLDLFGSIPRRRVFKIGILLIIRNEIKIGTAIPAAIPAKQAKGEGIKGQSLRITAVRA